MSVIKIYCYTIAIYFLLYASKYLRMNIESDPLIILGHTVQNDVDLVTLTN